MKIAVTSKGSSLDDQVDPRFGRCPYFLIIESNTMDVEPIVNPNVTLGGGAGIQSAQLMSERDVKVVLTGNCGPNAFQTLNAAGIEVIVGVSGIVHDAVEQLKSGSLSSTHAPNVGSHFGMGIETTPASTDGTQYPEQRMGMGRGIGGGRGMGQGMGRRMGRGMGRSMGTGQDIPQAGSQFRQDSFGQERQVGGVMPGSEQELEALKAQAQAVKQKLQAINERIAMIERNSVSSHLVAIVITKKCNACGICEGVCPVAAITVDTIAIIDRNKCTGCGKCVEECPQEAITLKKA